MSEIFLSLEEAAELEGAKYITLFQRIKRNEDKFITKIERQTAGGRDRVWVALSSLSPKARRIYKKRNPSGTELILVEKVNTVPWYVDLDFAWFRSNYKESYDKAVELSHNIKAFLDYDEEQRTAFAQEFAEEMAISQRTLYRYAESYLEAEMWAQKKLKETSYNYDYYKILAMCRKPRDSNTFPSLNPKHRAFIENVWFNKDFAANDGTIEMLFSQFETHFKKAQMEYPSYKTVARYINYLMTEGRMKNAKELARGGVREYKRNVMMKGVRDSKSVPVLGIIQGDSHTFDFWVQYRDPSNGKISAIKPTMVAWLDTRSRVVMGCVWAKTINSQVIKQSIAKLIYDYGVPECIYIDNGKDYTSKEMMGRERKERKSLLVLDDDTKGFYRSLGIKDDYRALPYQPWVKIIERFFNTVCQQFSKWFGSYTGTLTGSKTSGKIKKDVDKLLEQGKLLTMEEAYQIWDMWLKDVYHVKPHRGLKNMKEKWAKPMELFENAEDRIHIALPAPELVETLLMKPGMARIYQTGINKFGQSYMNYELTTYIGEKLPIRYDPEDMSKVYVYDKNGRKICTAESQELLQYQGHITEVQLTEHIKLQKRQLREDKERLAMARTPLELRGIEGATMITGKIELMIEKKKVDAIECKAEIKEETSKKEVVNDTEYFKAKADEVFKKIRKARREEF